MLTRGDVSAIAIKLGLSVGATSAAIKRGNTGHPAVREALRLAESSGAMDAAKALASLAA